jgi:hypothetical protein
MATVTSDLAAELHAAQGASERLVVEQAILHSKLEAAVRAGNAGRMLRLRRRQAELSERLFAAQVLAKHCYIATLEAELVQPRDDYDEAVQAGARDKVDYDEAKAPFERSRERLLRASGHLSKRERAGIEHSQALEALLTEAHIGASEGSPIVESPEG